MAKMWATEGAVAIYIYIYAVESKNLSKIWLFESRIWPRLSQKICPRFVLLVFPPVL